MVSSLLVEGWGLRPSRTLLSLQHLLAIQLVLLAATMSPNFPSVVWPSFVASLIQAFHLQVNYRSAYIEKS